MGNMYLFNERKQEFINLNDLIDDTKISCFNNISINELYLKIPGWRKSDQMMLSTISTYRQNIFKEIFVDDFDKRSLNVLEDSLVNVYKKLFNVCLNGIKIKGELRDDFEVI